MPRSIVHATGVRVKSVLGKVGREGGDRERREGGDRERREGGKEREGGDRERRGRREGFEDEDSSDWLYGFLFFVLITFILSPGVLLTIPPGRGGLFMSRNTSIIAALVHALIIVLITSSI